MLELFRHGVDASFHRLLPLCVRIRQNLLNNSVSCWTTREARLSSASGCDPICNIYEVETFRRHRRLEAQDQWPIILRRAGLSDARRRRLVRAFRLVAHAAFRGPRDALRDDHVVDPTALLELLRTHPGPQRCAPPLADPRRRRSIHAPARVAHFAVLHLDARVDVGQKIPVVPFAFFFHFPRCHPWHALRGRVHAKRRLARLLNVVEAAFWIPLYLELSLRKFLAVDRQRSIILSVSFPDSQIPFSVSGQEVQIRLMPQSDLNRVIQHTRIELEGGSRSIAIILEILVVFFDCCPKSKRRSAPSFDVGCQRPMKFVDNRPQQGTSLVRLHRFSQSCQFFFALFQHCADFTPQSWKLPRDHVAQLLA
mmetsp:Transcript_120884/g.387000  ORF Transcript_120884/g.387000 Transcript_120884/m.387000 type:complete len:367 (+) Transcript_120884:675-1775(+)